MNGKAIEIFINTLEKHDKSVREDLVEAHLYSITREILSKNLLEPEKLMKVLNKASIAIPAAVNQIKVNY